MAKLTAPLLSLDARGTLGDTLTFAPWRGIQYARQRVIPQNPNTTAQQATRNVFRTMSDLWKVSGTLAVAPWDAFAFGLGFLGRNAFMGQNVEALRGDADMTDFIGSPGARGGLPPDSIAVTPGSTQLTIDFTNPAAPTGWTLDSAVAWVVQDQDPAVALVETPSEGEDDVSQAQVVITGLTASVLYQVRAWLRWTTPDGRTAYSVSLDDTGTPTV